jgi:hypothetical protein
MTSTLLGPSRLDRDVRRGADLPRTAVGVAVASEGLQQQKKFLGQHLRRLVKIKKHLWVGPGERPENSIN